jgi:hypothetical protein
MENSWVDDYYDTLEFFYWEPQHLGRKKHVDSKLNTSAKVQSHLRSMEVTLNHQLKQFFTLAPSSLRNRVFEFAFRRPISGDFVMAGRDADKKYHLENATQPDFLFITGDRSVSIEMKIGAKSSIKQVLKYALLALAVEQFDGVKREHLLLFLGSGGFPSLWHEGFADVEDMGKMLDGERLAFLTGKPKHFQDLEARFFEIVSLLSVAFINYGALAGVLEAEVTPCDESLGGEVYRNLVGGMVAELKRRCLA